MRSDITIVIPVLNEAMVIKRNIAYLDELKTVCEVIFVDGDSTDDTVQVLQETQHQVIESTNKGRGAQLSDGASHVNDSTELVLFLHVDTKLPYGFESKIIKQSESNYWGRFDIQLDSNKTIYKLIQTMMNLRSKITGIATGDQAIFVTKDELMNHLTMLNEHPLMEDIYLSKSLKAKLGSAHIINDPVISSVRYWEKHGVIKTILKMWKYRLMYFFKVSPKTLYQHYYR